MKSLAVYCGSSHGNDPRYAELAHAFGSLMARRGLRLVYGGGGVGILDAVAHAVRAGGGEVTGGIPRFLNTREL